LPPPPRMFHVEHSLLGALKSASECRDPPMRVSVHISAGVIESLESLKEGRAPQARVSTQKGASDPFVDNFERILSVDNFGGENGVDNSETVPDVDNFWCLASRETPRLGDL
jgi:hypothetical protein